MLVPIDQAVNQYGNLPRNTLQKLKGRSDVFIGTVRTKSGEVINGVWQRAAEKTKITTVKAGKIATRITRRGVNKEGKLKLLIRFEDPKPVKQHLGWGSRARKVIDANWRREMDRALSQAMKSAK